MSPLLDQQFAAYDGIDWADTKHDVCLQAAGNTRREFSCIAHQVACIDEWAKGLHQRFDGPIAVALELGRCQKSCVLRPVNRSQVMALVNRSPNRIAN